MKPLYVTLLAGFALLFAFTSSLAAESNEDASIYRLGSGDKLRITVFEEPDLSGEFEVDGSGYLALPLIGEIEGGGLNLRELEKRLESKYKGGYLINPRVNIEVINFRHFFIMGEVNNPGSYPYSSGLTVLNAVALAGGFTHRAKEETILIFRINAETEDTETIKAGQYTKVLPGDTLRVKERFF